MLSAHERPVIVKFDGGLARTEVSSEGVFRSTWPPYAASNTGPSGGIDFVPPAGGKHRATIAPGNDGPTADRIVETWRHHWGIASQTS